MKLTEWKLEDVVKGKDDLYNLLWAGLDEIKEPLNEKDFEYLLILCQDVLDIAKKKGWNNENNNSRSTELSEL